MGRRGRGEEGEEKRRILASLRWFWVKISHVAPTVETIACVGVFGDLGRSDKAEEPLNNRPEEFFLIFSCISKVSVQKT
jgi:hypothetical protein